MDEFVEVIVDPQGELLVNGRQLERLERRSKGLFMHRSALTLAGVITKPGLVVISVIDAARSAGAESLVILARQP